MSKKQKQRIIRKKLNKLFAFCMENKLLDSFDISYWINEFPNWEKENKNIGNFWEFVNDLEERIINYEKFYEPVNSHGFLTYIKLHPEQDNWIV